MKRKNTARKIRWTLLGYEYIEFSTNTGRCLKVIRCDKNRRYLEDFVIGYERKEKELLKA